MTIGSSTAGHQTPEPENLRKKQPRSRDQIVSKQLSWLLRHGAKQEKLNIDTKGYVNLEEILRNRKIKSSKVTFEDIQRIVKTDSKDRYTLKHQTQYASNGDHSKSSNPATAEEEDAVINNDTNAKNWYICANQGHSIKEVKDVEMETLNSSFPHPIVHGTTTRNWELIKESGYLSRMSRNHIHFAILLPPTVCKNNTTVDDEAASGGVNGSITTSSDSSLTSQNKKISGIRPNSTIFIFINKEKAMKECGITFLQSVNKAVLSPGNENGHIPIDCFEKVLDKKGENLL